MLSRSCDVYNKDKYFKAFLTSLLFNIQFSRIIFKWELHVDRSYLLMSCFIDNNVVRSKIIMAIGKESLENFLHACMHELKVFFKLEYIYYIMFLCASNDNKNCVLLTILPIKCIFVHGVLWKTL